ncbi:MAG: glutathione S-transferase family protein [Robiginitomaculum sp.]|nr:glutathione S-transferase family protein [Robiginitomaculum sp.]
MLNIYGHFLSPPTNIVRLCVSYLGLPHEYIHVDLQKGEQSSPEYLKINPAGRVPALEDDGFLLSQSSAICKYMCGLSGPSDFYPEDLQSQAKVNQWSDFAGKHIMPAMGRLFFNKIVAGMIGAEIDKGAIKTGEAMLARDLPLIEDVLKSREFLAGDKLTLADITLIAGLEPAEMVQVDISAYPSIEKWRKTLMERGFYQRVHSHFAAEMQSS